MSGFPGMTLFQNSQPTMHLILLEERTNIYGYIIYFQQHAKYLLYISVRCQSRMSPMSLISVALENIWHQYKYINFYIRFFCTCILNITYKFQISNIKSFRSKKRKYIFTNKSQFFGSYDSQVKGMWSFLSAYVLSRPIIVENDMQSVAIY